MPLIYGCIAPHAGDLIPETVPNLSKVALTRQSMVRMGERLQALSPEVIVIINPHGFRALDAMSISVAEKAYAEWSPEVELEFDMDRALANTIADRASLMGVPIVRYIYGASGGPECFIPLDWGAVVPLYFFAHRCTPKPKIVHLSPQKLLSYRLHYDFGRAIGSVLQETGKRVAIVASADQGHAHNEEGPYGYDPASSRYDAWMQEIIQGQCLDCLLSADPFLVENGKPDSLWPTLVLAGALKDQSLTGRLLSYEIDGYFGILCAEFV